MLKRFRQPQRFNPNGIDDRRFLRGRPDLAGYEIGEYSYGDLRVLQWGEGATLRMGRFCSLGTGVHVFLGGEHRTDWVTTYPFSALFERAGGFSGHPRTKGDVCIGNDVWIGMDAVILSGVTIGNGACIGARSVVSRDVGAYEIVSGNPAKPIRKRFDEETIAALERIAWWDWPLEKIEENWPLLLNDDIAAFVAAHDPKK